jgi:hypothetical protein
VRIPVLEDTPLSTQGINLWLDPDGNLRSMAPDGTIYQYAKTAVTASSGTLPADPQPATLQKIYTADWAQSYCDVHGVETGSPGVWYGDSADGHIDRKIMIGLPDDVIRSDLAGAAIERVEIFSANLTASTSRVQLHWGLHNEDTAPAEYSAMRKDAYVDWWPRVGSGELLWRPIHAAFGEWLRDNEAKGLTIDQPSGVGNSGQLDWSSTKIRITYTK